MHIDAAMRRVTITVTCMLATYQPEHLARCSLNLQYPQRPKEPG